MSVGLARNPQYVVEVVDLTAANNGTIFFQNVGYIKLIRFQSSPQINAIASVVLDGQVNFSIGDIARGNPLPLLYNNEIRFPNGAARLILSWPAQPGVFAVIAYSADPNAFDLDTPNPKQLVTSALGATITQSAVNVTNVATLLAAADSGRFSATIQNLGSSDIFVGNATVTTANGLRVAANGGVVILDRQTAEIRGIAATAGPFDTRVLIERT